MCISNNEYAQQMCISNNEYIQQMCISNNKFVQQICILSKCVFPAMYMFSKCVCSANVYSQVSVSRMRISTMWIWNAFSMSCYLAEWNCSCLSKHAEKTQVCSKTVNMTVNSHENQFVSEESSYKSVSCNGRNGLWWTGCKGKCRKQPQSNGVRIISSWQLALHLE